MAVPSDPYLTQGWTNQVNDASNLESAGEAGLMTGPVASGVTPAVPNSTVAVKNPFGKTALVVMTAVGGGTRAATTVGGVAVNSATPAVGDQLIVPPNAAVVLVYSSGTPTWSWFLI